MKSNFAVCVVAGKPFGSAGMGRWRAGITLVELLVALGITLILSGLGLSAVQRATEAARRAQCANHLRNIGLAALNHEAAHRHYPSNGWGFRWVGEPELGYGPNQPGGWIYNVLSYLEHDDVRRMGQGETLGQRRRTFARRFEHSFELFYCPSRRSGPLFPYTEATFLLVNSDVPVSAAKSDYAINAGSREIDGGTGPRSYLDPLYKWPRLDQMNGVSFVRSRVRVVDVRDGTSRTILAGEKHVPIDAYTTGATTGDDQGIFIGDDADNRRFTVVTPQPDIFLSSPPEGRIVHAFGSAHPSSVQFVMCDGSVQRVDFEIDLLAFRRMGNRRDGPRGLRRP